MATLTNNLSGEDTVFRAHLREAKDALNTYREAHRGRMMTPERVLAADDIFTSTIDGDYATACELAFYKVYMMRAAAGSITGQLQASSSIQYGDVIFIVRSADYTTKIENKLYGGDNVASIKMTKLLNADASALNKPAEEIEFTNCNVTYVEHLDEFFLFAITFEEIQRTVYNFGQDDTASGQMVSGFNLRTAALKGG